MTTDPVATSRALELALLALVTRDLAINWQADLPPCVELESAIGVLIALGYTPDLFYGPQALDALANAYCPPQRKPRLMVVPNDEDDGPKAAREQLLAQLEEAANDPQVQKLIKETLSKDKITPRMLEKLQKQLRQREIKFGIEQLLAVTTDPAARQLLTDALADRNLTEAELEKLETVLKRAGDAAFLAGSGTVGRLPFTQQQLTGMSAQELAGQYVSNVNQLQGVQQQLGIPQIQDFLDSLKVSTMAPGDALTRLAEAQAQFSKAVAEVQGGDVLGAAELPQLAQQLLSLAQEAYASGPQFAEIFRQVQAVLADVLEGQEEFVPADLEAAIEHANELQILVIQDQTAQLLAGLTQIAQELQARLPAAAVAATPSTGVTPGGVGPPLPPTPGGIIELPRFTTSPSFTRASAPMEIAALSASSVVNTPQVFSPAMEFLLRDISENEIRELRNLKTEVVASISQLQYEVRRRAA